MKKHTVLVVDDEKNMVHSIERTLRNTYNVISCTHGYDALNTLKAQKVDIVITDLKMPEIDGAQLTKKIKKLYPEIGIILLTAHGDVDSYIELNNLGIYEYLHKPFENETLLTILEKLIEERHGKTINN